MVEKDIAGRLRRLGNSLSGLDWCDSLAPYEAAVAIEVLIGENKRLKTALCLARNDLNDAVHELDNELRVRGGD